MKPLWTVASAKIERQGVLFVDLARIEHSLGRSFTDEQVAAATEGRP